MSFREFEDRMLVALYRAWQDGRELVSLGAVAHEAGIAYQRGWLVRVHDSLADRGLLRGPANRRVEEMTVGTLTSTGLQHVEDHLLSTESVLEPIKSEENIDSSAWTGLPRDFILTEDKRISIVRALDQAEHALPDTQASQHDQAQARAYIVAAKALLEAPEPELDFAWQLIGRANNLAGIASLFIAILALFSAH